MLRTGKQIRYRITDILALHWEAFFQSERRWIRPVVLETVRKLLACRTPALGCHVYVCPDGHESRVVPHSCKSRFCPTCGKHATDRWAAEALSDLLEVEYHHVVLSAPWQLRSITATNREVCLSILARAATACFTQWAREQHGMRMGLVTVIHTFGSDLKWHPHLHLLVTEGGLSLDGERWIRPYNLGWLMGHAGLKRMWKYHVLAAFRRAHREGQLRFQAGAGFLGAYPCFNGFLNRLWQLTWYAHIGACLLDPSATLRYIGRYTKRAVLAEYRITHYDGKLVRFTFTDYAQGGKTSFKTLPVLAFIGRLVRHIPDKHFKMVRYGGLFAPRWRAEYLDQARRALGAGPARGCRSPGRRPRGAWHVEGAPPGRDRRRSPPLLALRAAPAARGSGLRLPRTHPGALPAGRPPAAARQSRTRHGALIMSPPRSLFTRVRFTCGQCGARQRIPLRRVHVFERFHGLTHGEVLLIACPQCRDGLQIPTPYRTHTGQDVSFDPEHPDNTVIHAT